MFIFTNMKLTVTDVKSIHDIKVCTDGVEYTFSDGIGKVSRDFAKEITKKLGRSEVPSAFQVFSFLDFPIYCY